MSFQVVLQRSLSDRKKLEKDIIDVKTLSGTLKNETSIVNPTIICEVNVNEIANVNYMTITSFGRRYFITDITSIRNGLVEISGHCDVLTTYAGAIKSNTAVVKRQENNWNMYVPDEIIASFQNPIKERWEFPSGFTSGDSFVLMLAGKQPPEQE